MRILYSFNKRSFEARYWESEIRSASTDQFTFVPFNHDPYLDYNRYARAQLLDNLYYSRHPGLMALYADFERVLEDARIDAILVDNCPPYHPDYLRRFGVYKVLRVADGPMSAYDRDFAYVHAYDHILYHSPAYSRDLDMAGKLRYCGARRADLWPLALFDTAFDVTKTADDILTADRDVDIVFVGTQHTDKLPLLAAIKRVFGRRFRLYGRSSIKKNVYFNLRYGLHTWVRPIAFEAYVPLYQRAKIGINVHNRGKYTVGSYRLFELPGNGVMQLSDGDEYLDAFYRRGEEIVAYRNTDDLIDKLRYFLGHDEQRRAIALNGFQRTMRDHRIKLRMRQAAELIERGMSERSQSLRKAPAY